MKASKPDITPCGIFSFNDDWKIMHVNRHACEQLNYQENDLTGQGIEILFTLPTKIFFQTHFFPLLRMQGYAEEIYLTLQSAKGGELPVLMNARRSADNGETCCAFMVVHHRKKFEEELIAARKTAETALKENTELVTARKELEEHASKLEQQMQMIARNHHEMLQLNHAVTHSLKEPLRKVLMFASKIRQSGTKQEMEKMMRSVDQMKNVVGALQEYVWLDENRKELSLQHLNPIIADVIDTLSRRHANVKINASIQELPPVIGNAEQLQLLFHHILSNSVKFRKGEEVTITIRGTILKKNVFKKMTGKYRYLDFLRVEVEDNGSGFDAGLKDVVFQLFRKLHFGPGEGAGLALARKIVNNHGGHIEAESVAGSFTRITFELPLEYQ